MRIKVGYLKEIYENSGALVAAAIRSEGSTLLSGSTGTGKTTLLWYLLYEYSIALGATLDIDICDYKYEYTALYGCTRYHYEVGDIIATIDRFYQSFQETRDKHDSNIQHILVIDEYMSFISYLDAMSKMDKSYKEAYQRVSMEISTILAMGRTLKYCIISVVQQASAKLWGSSAERENYINKISMGTLSAIAAREMFDNADTSDIDFKKPMPIGCGYLAVQGSGEPIKEIIVPRITNPDLLQHRVRQFLDKIDEDKPP